MDAIYSSYGDWVKTPGRETDIKKGPDDTAYGFSQLRYVLAGRSDSVGLINKKSIQNSDRIVLPHTQNTNGETR